MKPPLFTLPNDAEPLATRLARRRALFDRSLLANVARIFYDVAERGDQAIHDATKRFDKVSLDAIRLAPGTVAACAASIAPDLREAIDVAIGNIDEVNRALMPEPVWRTEIRPGTMVGEKHTPLDAVGLWVPARKGPLVSTAIMLAVAARVAGVERIVMAMPPCADGKPDAGTVAAASLSGAHEFVMGNGVAVLAALTLGTESVPEVDGMFGPGPAAIAAAMATAFAYGKRTTVGLGPTDGLVLADDSADPAWVASDLLCEAEHGPDSVTVLVTTSPDLAARVATEVEHQAADVEEGRHTFLEQVFGPDGMGCIVVAPDLDAACEVVNDFAPEHCIVACDEPTTEAALGRITHAGEILLGHYTPFSAANYGIGITAVLPTSGFARAFSGVTCRDMLTCSTLGSLDANALAELLPMIAILGRHEGLPCHVASARVRRPKT